MVPTGSIPEGINDIKIGEKMNKEMWKILKDAEEEITESGNCYEDEDEYYGLYLDVEAIESISNLDECDKLIRRWSFDRGVTVKSLKARLNEFRKSKEVFTIVYRFTAVDLNNNIVTYDFQHSEEGFNRRYKSFISVTSVTFRPQF